MTDNNLRIVDLTGDGRPDTITTEDDAFVFYRSFGDGGFERREKIHYNRKKKEKASRIILTNDAESIYLADMNGDGLPDLVRITHSEVRVWSNQGYGHFGPKTTMDIQPFQGSSFSFDTCDQFDPLRIHLADIDGSGTTDIIYSKIDGVLIILNQSGNVLQEVKPLKLYCTPVETANSIICTVNTEGTITLINEYGAHFFGYVPDELVGQHVMTLIPEIGSEGKDLKANAQNILSHPERHAVNLSENVKKDGTRIWVQWERTSLTDAEGRFIGHLSVGTDHTAFITHRS